MLDLLLQLCSMNKAEEGIVGCIAIDSPRTPPREPLSRVKDCPLLAWQIVIKIPVKHKSIST